MREEPQTDSVISNTDGIKAGQEVRCAYAALSAVDCPFRILAVVTLMTASLAGAPPSACAQELRDYVPARNKSVNNYKQYFQLSSVTSESSSGDTSSFVVETSAKIKPVETMNEPLTITDSLTNKGGSSITAITINNFFPQGDGSPADITDAGLGSKLKDLSNVTLGLNIKSKEISEADKKLAVLNANFSSMASTTLSIYTESTSPTFVSIFEDVLFNKKTLTR